MLAEGAQWGDDDIDIDAEINDSEVTEDTSIIGSHDHHE